MQLTPNYRLRKPAGTDSVEVQDLNDNMDMLDTEVAKKLDKTGNASDVVNNFTQTESRVNLTSGEKLSLSLGKIAKWFADLKTVAFSGKYSDLTEKPSIPSGSAASCAVANNDTTTAAGFVADARIVKQHGDEIDKVNQDLGCLHYGTASDSMATILNAVLTYETIPQSETRHFSIQCQEGYFICRATAWDNNWIGGIASPGTDDTKNTYSFIRFASRGADTVLKKLGSATVFPKILLQPNAGQGTTDTYTLDVTEKSTLSIESMQSWYDNASVSIVADGTVLYTKSHQTGGSNRTDTSAIGTFDVSGNSTIAITFSATATNAGARGWAALNNISVS